MLARSAALPLMFHFLIQQFFVNKHEDIILKCSETLLGRYRMEDLKIAKKACISYAAERSIISAVCDFYKDNANEKQQNPSIFGKQ